jgi:hypothetical protein
MKRAIFHQIENLPAGTLKKITARKILENPIPITTT